MKNKKIIIIGIVISLIIISFIIFIIFKYIDKKNNYDYDYTPEVSDYHELVVENYIHRVDIRNDFYLINSLITVFNSRCEDLYSEYNTQEDIDIASEYLYNILNKKYIDREGITIDNIYDKFQNIKTYNFLIDDMYCIQNDENVYVYIIYGSVGDISGLERDNIKYIVSIDKSNDTYSIIPSTSLVEELGFGNVKDEDIISNDFGNIELIENYNTYSFKIINDSEYAEDLFNDFKNRMMYSRESAYSMLDSDYASSNYPDFESFKNYCISHSIDIVTMTFTNFNKIKEDNVVKYICLDENSNYYTFTEIAPMKYTVTIGK